MFPGLQQLPRIEHCTDHWFHPPDQTERGRRLDCPRPEKTLDAIPEFVLSFLLHKKSLHNIWEPQTHGICKLLTNFLFCKYFIINWFMSQFKACTFVVCVLALTDLCGRPKLLQPWANWELSVRAVPSFAPHYRPCPTAFPSSLPLLASFQSVRFSSSFRISYVVDGSDQRSLNARRWINGRRVVTHLRLRNLCRRFSQYISLFRISVYSPHRTENAHIHHDHDESHANHYWKLLRRVCNAH